MLNIIPESISFDEGKAKLISTGRKINKMKKAIITTILMLVYGGVNAATINVVNLNNSGAGSLRQAVLDANSGDIIAISVPGNITLNSQILINKDLVFNGLPSFTSIIDGNNATRIFEITAGNVTFNGLLFLDGNTSDSGGAMKITTSGTVNVNHCVFTSCHASNDGGALLTSNSTVNITDCTFGGNSANYDGGGIRINSGSTVIIKRSTFSGNSSGFSGAGIRVMSGSNVTVENTTLSGNNATLNGGGFEGFMTLKNCTITNNSAGSAGGGGKASSNTNILNCIFYNNTAPSSPDVNGNFLSVGFNIIGNSAGASGFTSTDMIGVDPLLGPLQDNGGKTFTHAIPVSSVAINAGSNCCTAPLEDQCDSIRVCNPDIGAFENLAANYGVTGTDVQTVCDSMIWIDGITYTSNNNTATFNIIGGAAQGCDSLVTLDLTVVSVSDITTSVNGIVISANNSNASYQWVDCDNGNAAIAGETNQSFTPTSNGNYAVELTENGCTKTSDCIAILSVGTDEIGAMASISIYPNPAVEECVIVSDQLSKNYRITDNSGKLIKEGQITANQTVVNLSDFHKGMYFLTIENQVFKLVKE